MKGLFIFFLSVSIYGTELREQYEQSCNTPSDINEHISVLYSLAKECSSVVEIGTRTMVSSWGIFQGLSESASSNRSYLGIDLDLPPLATMNLARQLAESHGISFRFWKANDMDVDIEPAEMLFIDSLHTYCHLTYELEKFSPKISKYIALHDTSWGDIDDSTYQGNYSEYPPEYSRIKRGLWQAVVDFLESHPEWTLYERRLNNYGFTILKRKPEPLFVSLGSSCDVAHVLKANNLRKEAFPFDWVVSIDSESFLDVLAQDFCGFLDEDFLCVGDQGPGPLIHKRYHLEFLHEGDFRGDLYKSNMEEWKAKYQRRIERFKALSEYAGKVIFLRSAYQHSTTDPHRLYHCADNLEITDEYATKLYRLLEDRFPKLDFTLVVINNYYDGVDMREETKLNDRLVKVRWNPNIGSWDSCGRYFKSLCKAPL